MPEYRQKAIRVEAIRLEYRILIQTPEGAMSAEAGDYLETIRVGGKVHQRIVPAWVFEASHERGSKEKHKSLTGSMLGDLMLAPLPNGTNPMVSVCEPHDGYPLTRE